MSFTSRIVAGAAVLLALGLGNAAVATAAHAPPTGQSHRPMVATGVGAATSANWAGYAITRSATSTAKFTRVFAAWVQPAVTCVPGEQTFSAFWVGLGGFNVDSQALEQVGTQADCSVSGKPSYSAWYELVPAAPVTIKLAVSPGDSIVASVAVSGRSVTVKIRNFTRKKGFTKKLTMRSPDLTSAEWVAEAPSTCTRAGVCVPLPLANFGTVTFVSASAIGGGHAGTIADPAWTSTAISLDGSDPRGSNADATPAPLSSNGSSFGVTWSPAVPATG